MIETEKRVREAVRYLGFGKNEADERTLELIQQSFKDLEQEAGPKSICQIFDLNHTDDGRLVIGQMKIQSKSLSRNLKGCRQVVLFGATLGAGVDRLMRRISLTDMARAVILQSCAAAMLEDYCDECLMKIAAELEEEQAQAETLRAARNRYIFAYPAGPFNGAETSNEAYEKLLEKYLSDFEPAYEEEFEKKCASI